MDTGCVPPVFGASQISTDFAHNVYASHPFRGINANNEQKKVLLLLDLRILIICFWGLGTKKELLQRSMLISAQNSYSSGW